MPIVELEQFLFFSHKKHEKYTALKSYQKQLKMLEETQS